MKIDKLISVMILSMSILCSCNSEFRSRKPAEFVHKSDVYKMLYYASLAGSSHNSQPWKVSVSGNRLIRLYADTTRELLVVDPDRRELYISLGAFIENLKLAAGSLGYEAKMNLQNKFIINMPVAEINLYKTSPTKYDVRIIEQRMTLRNSFSKNSIKNYHLKQILNPDQQNIRFYSSSSKEGCYIAQNTVSAYTQQAFNKSAQNELSHWIRFSDKDININKDGLTPAGMQINGFGGFIVRHFYKPEDSKKESFIKAGIEKTKKQVVDCGGWIVIISPDNSVNEWIKAGQYYQYIHLTCTKLHIGFQPMNQIVEEEYFKKKVAHYLGISRAIIFVARVGYVTNNQVPVSPRRPVEDFTSFNN